MLEAQINLPISLVVAGPDNFTAPSGALYLNGTLAGISPSFVQQGSTPVWSVSFTPNSTGVYSIYAFGKIQFQVRSVSRTSLQMLMNIEDEALGSWAWDKVSNVLTIYRQDGTTMATHNAVDSLTNASRERTS